MNKFPHSAIKDANLYMYTVVYFTTSVSQSLARTSEKNL